MISFVIPVYNEEKGFKKFYTEMLLPELKKLKYGYELILVNDGSKDKSLQIIQELAEKDKYVAENLPVYEKRLKDEIEVINPKGFASYMLVVQEYVRWANGHNVPTGPGRGSAAGSLALYLLGITKNIDPIKYHLLFSRFLTSLNSILTQEKINFL